MLKKGRFICICLLAAALSLVGSVQLRADVAEDIQKSGFFTGVSLKDRDRNDISSLKDVKRGTEVYLVYRYRIPGGGFVTGKDYTFTIPEEIYMEDNTAFAIRMDGKEVAQGNVRYDDASQVNVVTVNFSDSEAVQPGVEGDIWMGGTLSGDRIPNEGSLDMDFDLGLSDGLDKIHIDLAIDDQSAEVSVNKQAGTPDLANLTIPWEIRLKVESAVPADLPVTGLSITDTLPGGLTFNKNASGAYSCTSSINGQVTNGTIEEAEGSKIIYKPPADYEAVLGEEITLTLNTTFDLSIFSGKDSVNFQNKAEAAYEFVEKPYIKGEDGAVQPNSDTKKVSTTEVAANTTVNGGLLDKKGTHTGGAREINWEVTVNKNGLGIDNAVIADTLPAGLTVKGGASGIQIKDKGNTDVTASFNGQIEVTGQNIKINLGNIAQKYTITYTTTVEDSYYEENKTETFKNAVKFTGGPGPKPSISVDKNASVPVSNALVAKSGSYDRRTHTITWTVTLNQYGDTLTGPFKVTDEIPAGLTFVTRGEDFSVADDIAVTKGERSIISFAYNKNGRILTADIAAGTSVSAPVQFQFKTTVDDAHIWAVNSYNDRPFTNKAVLNWGGKDYPVTSNPQVISEMFKKNAVSYDSAANEIEWQFICNQNQMPVENAYIEDVIPDGQEYVQGSIKVKAPSGKSVSESYDTAAKKLKVTFPASINEQYTLTFRTKITDSEFLTSNIEKSFHNEASLHGDQLPEPIICKAQKQIKGSVLSKSGDIKKDSSNKNYLEWTILVNKNQAELDSPVIVDKLSTDPKLEFDPSSVKLYEAVVNADGTVTRGNPVAVTRDNVAYDLTDNTFKFHFLQKIDRAYQLVFRTDFGDDAKNKEINNEAYYEGSEADMESSSTRVKAGGSIAGGSSSISKGNVAVKKYNEDKTKELKGAVFEIYNDYVTYTMQPTDEQGASSLEQIRVGEYKIKEVTAPEGYVLDSTEQSITVGKDSTFTYEAYNSLIPEKDKPDKPSDPNKPADPGKPDNPDNNTNVDKSKDPKSGEARGVKTGDTSESMWYILMMAGAVLCIVFGRRQRMKNK